GGGNKVVAAIGVEDELLAGADIDRERRRVDAVEAHARAVGGDREHLGAVAAVDLDGINAGAAFEQVAVVAGIPDHEVVAALAEDLIVAVAARQGVVVGAAEQKVEAAAAEEHVVAGLAEQHIVARATGRRVVAGATEQVRGRQGPVRLVEPDVVVAAQSERLNQAGVRDRRRAAQDRDGAAVDQDGPGGIAADGDDVVEIVAEYAEHAGVRQKGRGDGHEI